MRPGATIETRLPSDPPAARWTPIRSRRRRLRVQITGDDESRLHVIAAQSTWRDLAVGTPPDRGVGCGGGRGAAGGGGGEAGGGGGLGVGGGGGGGKGKEVVVLLLCRSLRSLSTVKLSGSQIP